MRLTAVIAVLLTMFATSASGQVIFKDGFESGNLSHTENGFRWSAATRVTSEFAHTGSYSARFRFKAGLDGEDASAEQRFNLGGNYPEIWIKYDIYVPPNYYHRSQSSSANNKGLVTLWNGDYGRPIQFLGFEQWPTSDGSSRISYHPIPGRDMGHKFPGAMFVDRATDLGKWVEWIIHFKVASEANNDGVIRVWKRTEGQERQQVINVNNLNNYVSSGNYFSQGYLLGWSNSGFSEETIMYIDNIIFSTEPIGMNPPNPPMFLE